MGIRNFVHSSFAQRFTKIHIMQAAFQTFVLRSRRYAEVCKPNVLPLADAADSQRLRRRENLESV